MRYVRFIAAALLAASLVCVQVAAADDSVVFRPMRVERLPDLNTPRNGHFLAYVGGELTVIGGHTTGFIPTATAEYFFATGGGRYDFNIFP